jgi:amidase
LVDFAIGSDTGGSVRAPASFCGIYGIRPTHGRISLDGACPLAPIFDTVGWFARDAALLAQIGDVLLGGTPATPGRLLLATDAFDLALPGAADALAPAVARVTALLGDAEPVNVSNDGLPAWFDVFRVLQYADIWTTHRAWVTRERPTFGPQVGPRFEAVAKVQPHEVAVMRERRVDIMARLDALLANNAVLLLPTVPDIAPLLKLPPAETVAFRERALALLCIAGLGGLPQVTLPFGTLNGCPIGVSLIAARGNDEMLLDIAVRLGAALGRDG